MLSNIVLFQGSDSSNTQGLWETNGTANGTFWLTNGTFQDGFRPNAGSPMDLTVFGNQVLFSGRDANNRYELWTTDGTALDTVEFNPTLITGAGTTATVGLDPSDLTVFSAEVLFNGVDMAGHHGLWATNGSAVGTKEITGIANTASTGVNPTDMTVFGGEVLFNGVDNTAGNVGGLWATDGTKGGTHEITSVTGAASAGVDPTDITVFGGQALFNGADAAGRGLWVTNGATATEVRGTSGLNPTDITVFGSEVLFAGKDASGNTGLWVWNGTSAQELTGISGAVANLRPSDLTVYNGEVLFAGFNQFGRDQLWVTNGTSAGTQQLAPAGFNRSLGLTPSNMEVYNGQVLFSGKGFDGLQSLWTTNGTSDGDERNRSNFPSAARLWRDSGRFDGADAV